MWPAPAPSAALDGGANRELLEGMHSKHYVNGHEESNYSLFLPRIVTIRNQVVGNSNQFVTTSAQLAGISTT